MAFSRGSSALVISALIVVAAGIVLDAPPAHADSALNDYFGPRELSLGESLRGEATGARAITLNPAGLGLVRQLVFEGSYGFRPDDNASSVAVSACDSTNAVPGCYYYRYFSAEPSIGDTDFKRRAHEFGISLSRALSPRLLLGTTTKYFDYNSDMLGEEDSDGFGFDAGLIFRASKSINVGLAGYNLVSADSAQYPRAVGAGLALRPSSNLGLSFDGVWNLDADEGEGGGRYGGGLEYFYRTESKMNGYPLRAGAVYDAGSESTWITGGLGYANPKMALDIGARKQVDGGDELLVLAGLRLFSAR